MNKSQIQDNYFQPSILCRNGPIPDQKRNFTDIFCTIMFMILFVVTAGFVIWSIPYLTSSIIQLELKQLAQDNTNSLQYFWIETLIAIGAIIAEGFIMIIIILIIPSIAAILTIVLFVGLLGFIAYLMISNFFSEDSIDKDKYTHLVLAVFAIIALILGLLLLWTKRKKIFNLLQFLQISSIVIRNNIFVFPMVYALGMSIFQLLVWWVMTFYFFSALNMGNVPVWRGIVQTILVIVLWLWIHGLVISLSDFLSQSLTIFWYFKSKSQHPTMIRPTLKLVFYHFGTIVFGSIMAFIPEIILKITRDSQHKYPTLIKYLCCWAIPFRNFSKYGYMETIMEGYGFTTANQKTISFRRQIKSQFPHLYMLGHLYSDLIKLVLPITGSTIFFILIRDKHISQRLSVWITLIPVLLLSMGLFLQIATNFANIVGTSADICLMCYGLDIRNQRVSFGINKPFSCPDELSQLLLSLSIKLKWDGNVREDKIAKSGYNSDSSSDNQ